MSKENPPSNKTLYSIFSLLAKQVLVCAICFAVAFSMNTSQNDKIKGYAAALGIAMREEFDFGTVFSNIKERLSIFEFNTKNQSTKTQQ